MSALCDLCRDKPADAGAFCNGCAWSEDVARFVGDGGE